MSHPSADNADAEMTSVSDTRVLVTEPRGKPKSGRKWKEPATRANRKSGIIKSKPLKTDWSSKMKAKADKVQFKSMKEEIRDKMAAEKKAAAEAKKEREERRKANERKSEVVQVIKNVNKLKRAKKKELRRIEKRDLTVGAVKTV